MSLINQTPRDFTLIVNGVDYSSLLEEATGNWSSLDTSGLCVLTCRFILRRTLDYTNAQLDDRLGVNWQAGKVVQYYIGSNYAPVIGYSIIEKAQYSSSEGMLTLFTTCKLGYYNVISANDIGVCVNLKEGILFEDAVNTLLNKAGVGSVSVSMPRRLQEFIVLTENDSFIKLAGQISFANGYCLFQNNSGTIEAIDLRQIGSSVVVTKPEEELLQYSRLFDGELPPDFVNVSGSNTSRKPTFEGKELDVVVEQGQFDPIRTETRITRDREKRTITTIESVYTTPRELSPVWFGAGTSGSNAIGTAVLRRKITIDEYEPEGSPREPDPASTIDDCLPRDEGRLLKRTTSVYMALAHALERYYQVQQEVDPNFPPNFVPSLALVKIEEQVETWLYNLLVAEQLETNTNLTIFLNSSLPSSSLPTGSLANMDEWVKYTRFLSRASGFEFPELGDPTLGRGGDTVLAINPLDFRGVEREAIVWQKEADVWTGQQTSWVTRRVRYPDLVTRLLENDGVSLDNVVTSAFSLVSVKNETKQDWTPNEPGRFPPEFTEIQRTYNVNMQIIGYGSSTVGTKRTTIDLAGFGTSETAAVVGLYAARMAWGRAKGQLITFPEGYAPHTIKPLSLIAVKEQSTGYTMYYAADSLSLASELTASNIVLQGVWTGGISTGVLPVVNTPSAELPIDIAPAQFSAPYNINEVHFMQVTIAQEMPDPLEVNLIGNWDNENLTIVSLPAEPPFEAWGTIDEAWLDSDNNYWSTS